MELNTIFLLVFVVIVAVGACSMGYCNCIKKKQSPDLADKA